jgi:biopolymer transport protein TolR
VELSAQRVRSKTRSAVRRREDQIEQEEIESGELNLIPYLDMVTNLMLFLLASISAGIIFTQIDTVLPDKADSQQVQQNNQQNPDDQPLKLFVTITRDKMILWSISGLEGTLDAPKAVFQHTGHDGDSCDGSYMCENNLCDAEKQKCVPPRAGDTPSPPAPVFDYRALSNALDEIATRRYNGKQRKRDTYQITLQADGSIPYNTIASVMAAMRCHLPEFGQVPTGCALPTDDPNLKKAKDAISPDGRLYDTDRAPYDPKKMALFSDILFSTGFE